MVGPPPGRGTAVGLMWSNNKQGNWNGKEGPMLDLREFSERSCGDGGGISSKMVGFLIGPPIRRSKFELVFADTKCGAG